MFQMALLLLENICIQLFWNPFMNVEFMAQTSSIYDHFIIWPSRMILTFNLPEQMFQMALLLLKKNNYAKLFWNPCINVEFMAQTSSIYDHFIILTFKCDLDLQPTRTNASNGTATPQGDQLCQFILKFIHKCRSYGPDKLNLCNFQVWPWPSTYLKKMTQMAFLLIKDNNYARLFWNLCMNVEVMVRTNTDRHKYTRMHTCTKAHTYTEQKL